MPYIVRATNQKSIAVATLEEAQRYLHGLGWEQDAHDLRESGGTIGPLPDGTIIEVERTTWRHLASHAGFANPWRLIVDANSGHAEAQRRILDAFNAQEART